MAQWLDDDFNMKRTALLAQECSGLHTVTAICQAFETMFGQWNITKESVHVVLGQGYKECGVANLGRVAHALQPAVNYAVWSQRSISDCVSIRRKMVGHFKHSELAAFLLKDLLTQLSVKTTWFQQHIATRWNSMFYCTCCRYGVDHELPASLSVYQCTLIENILATLDPFE